MKQVNIRLDKELIKIVKILCAEQEITFQDAVKTALEQWVNKNKKGEV